MFEIDQPATQAVKLERLKKVINPLPAHVTFVPADLNTRQLGEVLRRAAYDEQGKTLFIWQGVTYFLQLKGVNATLAFVAEHSGAGSAVIFDYIYSETLHDTTRGYGKSLARAGRMSGEPYVFGIDKGQVGAFLAQRGFCDVLDVSLEEVRAKYFTGRNAGRAVPTDAIAIASAKVSHAGNWLVLFRPRDRGGPDLDLLRRHRTVGSARLSRYRRRSMSCRYCSRDSSVP